MYNPLYGDGMVPSFTFGIVRKFLLHTFKHNPVRRLNDVKDRTEHAFPERECYGYDLRVSGYALLLRLCRRRFCAALWLCGGEIRLGRHGVPVFSTVSSLVVLAANP